MFHQRGDFFCIEAVNAKEHEGLTSLDRHPVCFCIQLAVCIIGGEVRGVGLGKTKIAL